MFNYINFDTENEIRCLFPSSNLYRHCLIKLVKTRNLVRRRTYNECTTKRIKIVNVSAYFLSDTSTSKYDRKIDNIHCEIRTIERSFAFDV